MFVFVSCLLHEEDTKIPERDLDVYSGIELQTQSKSLFRLAVRFSFRFYKWIKEDYLKNSPTH